MAFRSVGLNYSVRYDVDPSVEEESTGTLPTITSLSALFCYLQGNTPIVITGTGFTGTTAVQFGDAIAQSFAVISDTTIICSPFPVDAEDGVALTVYTPNGSAQTGFSFVEKDVDSTVDRILFATNAEEIFGYIALELDGNVWGTIQNTAKLLKLEPDGTATVVTVADYTNGGPICCGSDGNLAIAINHSTLSDPVVYRVSTAGVLLGSVAIGTGGIGIQYDPRWIGSGPDGSLWIVLVKNDNATFTTEVVRVETDDTVTTLSLATGAPQCYHATFARDGFLYVVDDAGDLPIPSRKVFKVAQDCTLTSTITVSTIPDGCWMYGICVLGTGDLLITYTDFDVVNGVAIAAPSGLATAATHTVVLSEGEFLNFPFPGPDGNAYVPTYFQDDTANVVKVTPAGSSTLIELTGSEDTENSSFTGCVDGNGQVCVAMGGTTGVVQPSVYKVDEA